MMYLQVMRTKFDQFGGRAGRREFWLFMLAHAILAVIAALPDAFVFGLEWHDTVGVWGIYWFITLVPVLALGARRLHDTGRSGWWQALMLAWIPATAFGIIAEAIGETGGSDTDLAVVGLIALVFFVIGAVGTLVLLVLALIPGDADANDYGEPGVAPERPAVWWTVLATRYADFTGRTGRKEFWLFWLVNFVFLGVASSLDDWLFADLAFDPIRLIYALVTVVPVLALGSRRLRDIGRSGKWMLLLLLPIIGWIILLVWAIMPGQDGENSHGLLPTTPA